MHRVRLNSEGGLQYVKDRDVRREIWIKLIKDNNLGVARTLFDPYEIPLKTE